MSAAIQNNRPFKFPENGSQSDAAPLTHLAGNANTMAALLSVLDILPSQDRGRALATCSSLAEEVANALASLVDNTVTRTPDSNKPSIAAMCDQAESIETEATHVRILLSSIIDHVNSIRDLSPASVAAVNVITCFAVCAQRGVERIKHDAISIYLAPVGGAA